MKCEICSLKDAVIHIRQIQKDTVHELHICEECAREKGLIREEDSELPIANLLSGLLEGQDVTGAAAGKDTCPRCGMKATDFRKQGKLGCPECFTAFEKDVRAIVSQMAARPHHTGKVPQTLVLEKTVSPAEDLREELRSAVEKEEYELAAKLRDRLRALEEEERASAESHAEETAATFGEEAGAGEEAAPGAGTSPGTETPPGTETSPGTETPREPNLRQEAKGVFEFTGLADMKGWMTSASIPDASTEVPGGVVVSSRVRLARNLAAYPYPGRCTAELERECQGRIMSAFRQLPNAEEFTILPMDELSALERRILFERNLISQGYSLEKHKALVLSADESVVAVLGDEDHLRLVGLRAGACLEQLLARLDALDSALEESLPYAVSPEWGYLNTAITNLGTGLKASLMLHLPALSMSGLIKRAVKASAQLGLSIRGFYSESMESLGDMYIIANEMTIGLAEKEIIGNLGRIAVQLAGYENRTREELLEKRRVDIEDRVFRAWGLLTWCRYLAHREAIEALSALRLGVALGLVTTVDAPTITTLLFLSQKSHIQRVLQSQADAVDSKLIDYTRAKIIREALSQSRGG